MSWKCNNCGYTISDVKEDIKCPVCSGHMINSPDIDKTACDAENEKEWNGGYHNDFAEGRKTGEYCDPMFEKYVNGGEHYHRKNNLKVTSNPIILFISCFICITFPLFGPIILLCTTKNSVTGLDEESRYTMRTVSKVFLSVSIIITVLFIIMSVISAFVFPNS